MTVNDTQQGIELDTGATFSNFLGKS